MTAPLVGIIGYGEIGSAIATIYRKRQMPEPRIEDPALDMHARLDACDVVHVCVPAAAIPNAVLRRAPLHVVHSTVPIGTCRSLAREGYRVVHAPVRGIHPHLVAGIETFAMPVAGEEAEAGAAHLKTLGIRAEAWGPKWETTELAKLLCTTRYGVDIALMREAYDLSEKWGVDFDRVYRDWTVAYNDGYTTLGQWWFQRPVLRAMPGPIGGHCIVPNARLLAEHSHFARLVEEESRRDWMREGSRKPS